MWRAVSIARPLVAQVQLAMEFAESWPTAVRNVTPCACGCGGLVCEVHATYADWFVGRLNTIHAQVGALERLLALTPPEAR